MTTSWRGQAAVLRFSTRNFGAPEFWSGRLATLDYRGLSLDDLARIAADYRGFTAEEIRDAFARYDRPG